MKTSHPALLTRKLLTVFRYFIDIEQYVAIMDIKDCNIGEKNLANWFRFAKFAKVFYRQRFLPYGIVIEFSLYHHRNIKFIVASLLDIHIVKSVRI